MARLLGSSPLVAASCCGLPPPPLIVRVSVWADSASPAQTGINWIHCTLHRLNVPTKSSKSHGRNVNETDEIPRSRLLARYRPLRLDSSKDPVTVVCQRASAFDQPRPRRETARTKIPDARSHRCTPHCEMVGSCRVTSPIRHLDICSPVRC